MIALCVDDEVLGLETLQRAVMAAEGITDTAAFEDEREALDWAKSHRPDVAFLDIRMHGMDGLALARALREMHPDLPVIFCTGYDQYAIPAMNMHLDASYLMKPIMTEDVEAELNRLRGRAPEKRMRVTCFGPFDVYVGDRPIRFKRSITKEILAYLIDRRGATVNIPTLSSVLQESGSISRQSVYQSLYQLKTSLREAGVEDVLFTKPGSYAINTKRVDCDYYRLLEGDESARTAFHGEYMSQYSWAEDTCGWLIYHYMGGQGKEMTGDGPKNV